MGNALSFNNSSTICVVGYFCSLLCDPLFTFFFLCVLNSLTYHPSCAVSRKQMRNLKYRLRYTGLTFWPCWKHQIPNVITRCTEPFGVHHQSLCAVSPPCFPLLLPCMLSRHSQTERSPLPGLNSRRVVQHCSSFLKCSYSDISVVFITCASRP